MRVTAVGIILFSLLPIVGFAAAPVSELGRQSQDTSPRVVPVPPAEPAQTSAFNGGAQYQMQMLQEEVRTLRGMVEELSHEIRQLKSRQLDDYMDLDRRLSAIAAGDSSVTPTPNRADGPSAESPSANSPAAESVNSGTDEAKHYNNAYNQLKAGKTEDAIALFKKHLSDYPDGKLVANAHYWLGEIYLLQNDLDAARQAFSAVVEQYPANRKASDAAFKLGQVYFLMGDKAKAKSLLETSAAGNDNAATLAKRYLDQHF
ncbi:YbgF trimerization domain-containing protein [uncultured Porticoccus sp.]|uniref:YbgF trimerization domain-containing protein n=1 Tax=uncultured Porticoccus sp. TaxID=1256050 RepID=UPI00261EF832|nr:YbgF trimerization domain-containing protein [uncultured Porticoccus sp.]